jgi:predicted nucleic acid-binding protein
MPNISLSEPDAVRVALAAYQDGTDFADALHVASSRQAKRFASFDRALIKASKRVAGLIEVFEPVEE